MSEAADGATLDAIADRYYAEGDGTRKAMSYFRAYEQRLAFRREKPLRILELGVSSGASLLLWRDYLPRATIIGVDIAEQPACLADQARVHFIQGSQDDPAVLDLAAQVAGGGFDLIVDDASHIGFLTKRSFNYLFPRWLLPGGCYVIEDIGTGFLPEYPDGAVYTVPPWNDAVQGTAVFQSHQYGMIGVVKQLIDHIMQELMTNTRSYLPIERITIESNIVFVDKAQRPGAPVPGSLPIGIAPSTVDRMDGRQADIARGDAGTTDAAKRLLKEMDERLRTTAEELVRLNARVVELELVLGRLLRRIEPLRRLWTAVTGRHRSSEHH